VADTLNDKIIDNLKATTFRLFFICNSQDLF
jgi:hypothetical protein